MNFSHILCYISQGQMCLFSYNSIYFLSEKINILEPACLGSTLFRFSQAASFQCYIYFPNNYSYWLPGNNLKGSWVLKKHRFRDQTILLLNVTVNLSYSVCTLFHRLNRSTVLFTVTNYPLTPAANRKKVAGSLSRI